MWFLSTIHLEKGMLLEKVASPTIQQKQIDRDGSNHQLYQTNHDVHPVY
jgi:hypothetical protein